MGLICAANGQSDPLDIWNERALPSQERCVTKVAYGNGTFVAMGGDDGRCFTSSNGETWFQRLLPADLSAPEQIAFLNGRFFATTDPLLTSEDGITWTDHPGLRPWKLTFGNGIFVGISANSILVSSNGVDWRVSVTSSTLFPAGVMYGNGLFVVVAQGANSRGIILSSTDGNGWTFRREGNREFPDAVVFGNGRFVVQGDFGNSTTGIRTNTLYSLNGVEWSANAQPSFLYILDESITFQHGIFLAGGWNSTNIDTPLIFTSLDAVNWLERRSGDEDSGHVRSFAYGAGTFVAVGSCRTLQSGNLSNAPPAVQSQVGIKAYPGISLTGSIGREYSIEYTTNVDSTNDWLRLTSLLLLTNPTLWIDTEATSSDRRFYRALPK